VAGRQFAGTVTYKTTSNGHSHGGGTAGIDGHGAFSAKLGTAARAEAVLLSLATGVPFTGIARGGTYTAQSAETNAANTGIVVAKFRERALGTACLQYVAHSGKFNMNGGYIPYGGTLTMVGGTGAAARWRGSASFHQTGIGGHAIESLLFGGAIHASTGSARGLTAACRKAAKA
jgi:hypothetical protein